MKTETTKVPANSCSGKLVKATSDKLTCTCEKGDEHNYTVAKDAKVTCDSKQAKLSDIKKGTTIRMTMCKDDQNKILAVESGKNIPALTHA